MTDTLKGAFVSENNKSFFVLWNVGQGQWATWAKGNYCWHFDMGGEKYPAQVDKLCAKKINIVSLSHWDLDHISFIEKFKNHTQGDICLLYTVPVFKKLNFKLPKKCPFITEEHVRIISQGDFSSTSQGKQSNASSLVFMLKKKILLPGDSPSKQEKKWSRHTLVPSTKLLILGHHGSKNSTSTIFLNKLDKLKMAWASARYQKYNHPHSLVWARLASKNLKIMSTEVWGNLIWEI